MIKRESYNELFCTKSYAKNVHSVNDIGEANPWALNGSNGVYRSLSLAFKILTQGEGSTEP